MTKWLTVVLMLLGMCGVAVVVPVQGMCADTPTMAAVGEKVNVNTATVEQLTTLPGIGEATAKTIVDYRDNNGVFRKVEDLLQVKGIGEKKLEAIRGLVAVE